MTRALPTATDRGAGPDPPPEAVLTDREFVRAFEDCSLPQEMFAHRNHLRLAWLYLQNAALGEAEERMERSIRRYAGHHGASQKYHHTITLFWMRVVEAAKLETPDGSSFDAFVEAHPELLDKAYLRIFYSPGRLEGTGAREAFVDPDLRSLRPASRPSTARS